MRLPFLRKTSESAPLIVSMSGVRLGDAVIFAGVSSQLALPLAARTGLSGRCLVIGSPDRTAALAAAALADGLLVETAQQFPSDRSFEVAIVEAVDAWAAATASAREAVRGGGRVIAVIAEPHQGLFGRLRPVSAGLDPQSVVMALSNQGWHRARVIGTTGRMTFVEAFA